MPAIATPKATTVPQSAREWPRSFGRHTTSSTSAAAASRRVTTPSAPVRGISGRRDGRAELDGDASGEDQSDGPEGAPATGAAARRGHVVRRGNDGGHRGRDGAGVVHGAFQGLSSGVVHHAALLSPG